MKFVSPDDPILFGIAKPVEFPDRDLSKTACLMLRMMITNRGCGLAAPQIGIPLRLFAFTHEGKLGTLVNPIITFKSPELVDSKEGCLTFPGKFWNTKRHRDIRISFQDIDGRQSTDIPVVGFPAVIFQHECDHLDGILISQHGSEADE